MGKRKKEMREKWGGAVKESHRLKSNGVGLKSRD